MPDTAARAGMVSRRRTLQLAGGSLLGLAGCVGRPSGTATDTATPDSTDSSPPSATVATTPGPTGTDTPERPDVVEIEGAAPDWTRSLDAPISTSPVYADGHVVVVGGSTVYGLDAATGETAWTLDAPVRPDPEYERVDAWLRVRDGTVYALVGLSLGLGGRDYSLFALDPDGTERWRYATGLGRFHRFAGFGGGVVVLATHDDAIGPDGERVFALDRTTGDVRWIVDTGDAYRGAVTPAVAALVVGGGVVDCFDLASGERRFRFTPDVDGQFVALAAGEDRIFAGFRRYEGSGPTLYAQSAADGSTDWTLDDAFVTSLRYLDDLYVGGEAVLRLDADGTERWRYEGGGLLTGVPFDDDALYTNVGAEVVAVRRRDGREAWASEATKLAIPCARGGGAVVSADGTARTVFAHATADGGERWRATVPDEHGPAPAASDDSAYLVTERGTVVGIPL